MIFLSIFDIFGGFCTFSEGFLDGRGRFWMFWIVRGYRYFKVQVLRGASDEDGKLRPLRGDRRIHLDLGMYL